MTIGVDVFEGNGQVDWKSAKQNGNVSFALLRAAEATVPDKEYATYVKQCAALGIKTGAYLFFHWTSYSPEAQGSALVKAIGKPDKTGFPPTIDVEKVRGVTPSQALDVLERCARVVRDAIGVRPMIYTSKVVCEDPSQLDNVLATSDFGRNPLWLKYWPYPVGSQAVYSPAIVNALPRPAVPSPWAGSWLLEQYQGDAVNLPGFSTNVDMNRLNVVKQGDVGGTVTWVQEIAGKLVVDGSFGPATAARIRELQLAAGLTGDAIVGLETWPILLWKNT